MKKTIVMTSLLIGLSWYSQGQTVSKNALGLRIGDNDGFGGELSYQRKLATNNRLELDLGWRSNNNIDALKLAGIYQWGWNIEGGFNWYAGVGGGLGYWNHDDNINDDNQKILLLTKEMFEYQQANIEFINQKTPFYDAQCTKEIENIYALQKIQAAIEEAQKLKLSSPNPNKKLKFNGNLNQLVDMFYQLNRELFIDGKPYIDENTNDLADWIVNSFLDKEGKEISPLTVKTILKPSKEDKRPNTHKRLDIDKLL